MTTPTPAAAGGAKGGGSERSGNVDTKRLRELADEATARGGLCAISPSTILRLLDERDALRAANRELQTENTQLRGFAAKVRPCHYCGLDDMSKCAYGFPGCPLMDDLMAADAAALLPPPAPLAGDGEGNAK